MVVAWVGLLNVDDCGGLSSEVIEAADIRLASNLLSVSSRLRRVGTILWSHDGPGAISIVAVMAMVMKDEQEKVKMQ